MLQLWSVGRRRHILLVSMHHAITDGLSITIMKCELAAAYAAACSGTQPSWQQLPVQFVDYAAWQRSHLQLDEELAWWTDTLAGAPPLLELPYDRPRPDVFSHQGANVQLAVPAVTSSDLAALAAQHQTTPFVVALTALQVGPRPLCFTTPYCTLLVLVALALQFAQAGEQAVMLLCILQVLLAKYSSQDDIVVGTPFANRNVPGVEGLLGCFVNTLAVRMKTSQSSSIAAALKHTKAAVTAAFAHGATPFAKVVESIGAVRSASFAPIYQVSSRLHQSPVCNLACDCKLTADKLVLCWR